MSFYPVSGSLQHWHWLLRDGSCSCLDRVTLSLHKCYPEHSRALVLQPLAGSQSPSMAQQMLLPVLWCTSPGSSPGLAALTYLLPSGKLWGQRLLLRGARLVSVLWPGVRKVCEGAPGQAWPNPIPVPHPVSGWPDSSSHDK